jgi:hypothetical protein
MSSRKEQKEQLRREREEREKAAKAAERRRRMVGYGVGGGLATVALIVLVVLLLGGGGGSSSRASEDVLPGGGSVPEQKETDVVKAARAAGCELKSFKSRSRDHVSDIDEKIKYSSNPPSEGRHYEIPAEDGSYDEAPKDTELVHSLEHGRIIIWFKPTLQKDVRADLRALFDDDPYQMLLVPRTSMPYAVASTAWNRDPEPYGTGRLLGCPSVSDKTWDALRTFRDEHRSNGPEPVP